MTSSLVPKLVTTLKEYDRAQLADDAVAGLIVGVVAVPLALAFGIASGVTPSEGLYAAVIGGFLISALGGSRVQIGGPTGAFVVIIYGIVHQYGRDGLTVCTLMAGAMLVGMGLARMGSLIKWIPYPVVTGFTSGIAVIIFSSQVKDLLGLTMEAPPAEFLLKWGAYAKVLDTLNPAAFGLSLGTLAVLVLLPRWTKKVPAPFAALVVATAAVAALGLPVETIGSRFGELPRGLPAPSLPSVDLKTAIHMVRPAAVIALLAAIESLLSAVVADGMTGGRHRSNMELVAQGVANVASPLFGGIPVTGAIARTATNVKSGARTPVAGIVHALFLACVLLFAGPLVARIPLAALAAILVIVSYHMSEWRTFAFLLKAPRSDVAVLLATFLLTVLVDLTVAVEVGMVLAAFLFMRRMAEMTSVAPVLAGEEAGVEDPGRVKAPAGVQVFEVNGPLFFGAADKIGGVLNQIGDPPKLFVLRLGRVPAMDATGLHALRDLQKRCRRRGTRVVLCGLRDQPLGVIRKAGVLEEFDAWTERDDLRSALAAARDADPSAR